MKNQRFNREQPNDRSLGGRFNPNSERGFGQADRYDRSYAESYDQDYLSRDDDYEGGHRGIPEHVETVYAGPFPQQYNRPSEQSRHPDNARTPQALYSGKGPKGYVRSDDTIKDEAHDLLTEHRDIDASDIEIDMANGELTLTGTVPDRQSKRLAEVVVEHISGVSHVFNRLKIRS